MDISENTSRFVVVGTSGSGKSTLARRLAARLRVPHVELDSLYWESDWVEAPIEVFRARVDRATASPSWVIEGNYGMDSILVWMIQTYGRRKREYPELLARPEYAHLKVFRFRTPGEAEAYLIKTGTAESR